MRQWIAASLSGVLVGCTNTAASPDAGVDLLAPDLTWMADQQTSDLAAATPAVFSFIQARTYSDACLGSVGVGDLNDDGKADVVCGGYGESDDVKVLLGAGDGTFAAPVSYAVGSPPRSVAISDLNGDGKADLVVVNHGVSVLLNKGDGTFATAANYAALTLPGSPALGDLDGDGKTDLAVASSGDDNGNGSGVSVLINRGDGTFAAAVNFAAGAHPTAVAVGDLDGDGRNDLAVTYQGDLSPGAVGGLGVLINKGNTVFAAPVSHAAGTYPASVAIADLDGDGDADIAVGAYRDRGVFVLTNNGGGSLSDARLIPTGGWATSIKSGDLNGDGRIDLALTTEVGGEFGSPMDSWVTVLMNTRHEGFAAINYRTGPGLSTGALALGDIDGDGHTDLVTRAMWLRNIGDGTLSAAVLYPDDGSLAIDDLNGDGKQDLVFSSCDGVRVALNKGGGTFPAVVSYRQGGCGPALLGQLDGDDKPDLVVLDTPGDGVIVRLNQGDGTFSAPLRYAAGHQPSSFALGDLNADGRADLVLQGSDALVVSVLLNDGRGAFSVPLNYAAGTGPFAVGDLDGDRNADLVVGNWPEANVPGSVSVLMNKGDGTFSTAVNYGGGLEPSSVALGDIDGDGWVDIAVGGYGVFTLPNNGNATFRLGATYTALKVRQVLLDDIDGDNRSDLVVLSGGSERRAFELGVLKNEGGGSFAAPVGVELDIQSVAIGDLNGDGKPDLAAHTAGGWALLINDTH